MTKIFDLKFLPILNDTEFHDHFNMAKDILTYGSDGSAGSAAYSAAEKIMDEAERRAKPSGDGYKYYGNTRFDM